MRKAPRVVALAAVLAGGAGAGGGFALGQGASLHGAGTAKAGHGTVLTPTPTPTPPGPPRGTVAEQTHPSVHPRTGGRRTRFTVRLTLGDAPGHRGVLATAYRLWVGVPAKHPAARCAPSAPATIDSGIAHQVVRLALSTPHAGWCKGRYKVTVFLERGPYCPRAAPGQPPTPCPEFASQDLDVGSAHFIVAPKH